MSRKNHKMIDGRLLQTNKKYSQLKMKQKEKIAEWMFQATRDYYMKKCTFPSDKHLEEVVDSVYEKIEDAEIWIPYGEVFKHYKSKRSDINKRVRKSLNEKEESQIEKVCFMNMCMIQDHKGNVLALDKVNDSYTGTTFPGGHVEANEIFQKSMIREVWEETGLTVEAPKLGGLYHWHKSGVHYVITLYKADKFTGELKSSEEGRVYWIPLEELKTKELATGMERFADSGIREGGRVLYASGSRWICGRLVLKNYMRNGCLLIGEKTAILYKIHHSSILFFAVRFWK